MHSDIFGMAVGYARLSMAGICTIYKKYNICTQKCRSVQWDKTNSNSLIMSHILFKMY